VSNRLKTYSLSTDTNSHHTHTRGELLQGGLVQTSFPLPHYTRLSIHPLSGVNNRLLLRQSNNPLHRGRLIRPTGYDTTVYLKHIMRHLRLDLRMQERERMRQSRAFIPARLHHTPTVDWNTLDLANTLDLQRISRVHTNLKV